MPALMPALRVFGFSNLDSSTPWALRLHFGLMTPAETSVSCQNLEDPWDFRPLTIQQTDLSANRTDSWRGPHSFSRGTCLKKRDPETRRKKNALGLTRLI